MADDFVCGEDYKPLIPNGIYQAQCVKYDTRFVLGKARKLFLHFRIIEPGEHFGKTIFMAFNMPYNRRIKQGSKYYKTWCLVNGYTKPSRNATMSPRLFKNKVFKVKTRTVKPTHGGKEMPEAFYYSCVDTIEEIVVG
jgi:hypothetical protein